jgi:type I site-specific restriction endonuclease
VSTPTEARTRKQLIDPALEKAGWDVTNPDQVGIEIPVDGFDPQAWRALEARLRRLRETGVVYDVELPKGASDYVLYRPNGETIAVVEAKRTSMDPRLAVPQTEFYVTEIEKQQEFANIVHKFERLRAQQREAERQAEHLFQTLLHQAFRGELGDPKVLETLRV